MLKAKPIIFSDDNVRAILAGRKTQTRRVIKQAGGLSFSADYDNEKHVAELSWLHGDGPGYEVFEKILRVPCPYGKPGDWLWVRETWNRTNPYEEEGGIHYYRADGRFPKSLGGLAFSGDESWRPSIHMYRGASRILLEITGVRVEQLHDISDKDARAEGVDPVIIGDGWRRYNSDLEMEAAGQHPCSTAIESYRSLWDKLNARRGYGWDKNPWVWVIEFRGI